MCLTLRIEKAGDISNPISAMTTRFDRTAYEATSIIASIKVFEETAVPPIKY
jgi:hypothetical protein